ncbi:adenylyltransferase/cytidyltransferase family protein [Streptomyces asoensis]|uniref:adenylyltransferase/cytidyltransferase family protein n=1 Tax=Streptomyces asoensis TaxID=249586 RepID=UPI0034087E62
MRALFPGSFDPITQGHQDVLRRAALLFDYCRLAGIDVVVRGVRGVRDLDYEMPMARMNHELAGVETFFLAADPALAHISSTLVTAMGRQERAPG